MSRIFVVMSGEEFLRSIDGRGHRLMTEEEALDRLDYIPEVSKKVFELIPKEVKVVTKRSLV